MRIRQINFGNKVVDFETARRQKEQAPTAKPTKPARQGDSYTKTTPTEARIAGSISDVGYSKNRQMPEGISPGVEYFRLTDPAVNDPADAIFYSSQFNLLSDLMQEKDEYKITPEDAAKELIRILKTGEPAKAVAKALDEDYQKADAFFAAYYRLTQTLDNDVKTRNLMAAIEIIAEPIESMSDEFLEELDDNEDESDDDLDFLDDVFYLENLLKIQSGETPPEEAEAFWKNVDKTFIDIMCMPEPPRIDVGFQFRKDFDHEKLKEAFGILVDKLAETQRLFIAGVIKPPVIGEPTGDTFTPSKEPEKED